MSRSRPSPRSTTRKRPPPKKPVSEQIGSNRAMKIGFVVLAMLFTCSLLASAFVVIPFDELFGLNDEENAENLPDPNEDLIEEQMQVVEENPDDIDSVLLLANILGNTGRLDEAIPYYERAVELAPEDASVRLDFARALADGGLHADAELQFERTIELNPDSQEAHYYLAELYMEWEPPRTDEAVELYEEAIALDPDSQRAELARNRLSSIAGTTSDIATPEPSPATPAGDGTAS